MDRFPATRHSLLAAATSGDAGFRAAALEELLEAYWKPVYKYLRLKWRKNDDAAADLTQSFFAALLEREWLGKFDPARGTFRTYLRTCLDGVVMDELTAGRRLKRGGGQVAVPLDFAAAERELGLAQPDANPEELFHREWQRELFALAVEDLRRWASASGRALAFAIFEAHDLSAGARPSYADLAGRHGVAVTKVTNDLAWARRELRRLALDRLAGITSGEAEWRAEGRALFGDGA